MHRMVNGRSWFLGAVRKSENFVRTTSLKEETLGAYSFRTHQALPLLQRVHLVATEVGPVKYVKVLILLQTRKK